MAKDIPQHTTRKRTAKVTHKPAPRERRGSSSSRGYDRKWEAFRKGFLMANPLCEYCLARGQVVPATVCDHDIPHEGDPELFWDNTFSALCATDHNSTKQRMERQFKGDALLRAIRDTKAGVYDPMVSRRDRVESVEAVYSTLVWGPPAAGKTTWARDKALKAGAVVYDLDDIAVDMGLPRYGRSPSHVRQAMDAMFNALGQHPKDKPLVLINSGASKSKRMFWANLIRADAVTLISEPMQVCFDRIDADPDRAAHRDNQREVVREWFDIVERNA